MYQRNFGNFSVNYSTVVAVVIIVAVIIGLIGIFSLGKAVIVVTPRISNIAVDFSAQIVTDGSSKDALSGTLFETTALASGKGEATGAEVPKGTNIIGVVTLINNYTKEQTLVATTRLLSPDKVLLRLKDKVTIPAGGKITVQVYADNPDAFKEIPATMFTIPGLWQGLQDKIYAESKDVIKNKPSEIKVVKAADIVKAKENITKDIDVKAIQEFSNNLPDSQNFLIAVVGRESIDESVGAKVGDAVSAFDVSIKQKMTLIAVEKEQIIGLANTKVKTIVSEERNVLAIDSDSLSYTTSKYNVKTKSAEIKIHAEAKTVIKDTNSILDKSKLVGLTPKGVQLYLLNFDEIENVDVQLSPFWVKKTPNNLNKIFVQVK
ncbi:hypothetical protein HY932_03535 [Candidatus Falkowbacteria bacterium]|nr:hypothetical protein [Candidatus Falkowbacteria bacterium]